MSRKLSALGAVQRRIRARDRARTWLKESAELRRAGFGQSLEERETEKLAWDLIWLCDLVAEALDV